MLTLPLETGIITTRDTTISGKSYTITTKWNSRSETYSMDVSVSNVEVAHGLQLLIGVDIWGNISTLPTGRCYCLNTVDSLSEIGYDDLDGDGIVIIVEDSDLED